MAQRSFLFAAATAALLASAATALAGGGVGQGKPAGAGSGSSGITVPVATAPTVGTVGIDTSTMPGIHVPLATQHAEHNPKPVHKAPTPAPAIHLPQTPSFSVPVSASHEPPKGKPIPAPKVPITIPGLHITLPHVDISKHTGGSSKEHKGGDTKVHIDLSREETNVYIRGRRTEITIIQKGEERVQCDTVTGTEIRAICAYCVDDDGAEHPASRMIPETWLESSYAGELYRCIPGTRLKATLGALVSSATTLAARCTGETIECGPDESLRHDKGGRLTCAPKPPRPECNERRALREYGPGEIFLAIQARAQGQGLDLCGMALDGGVGSAGYHVLP